MSDSHDESSPAELIRITFSVEPGRLAPILEFLHDQGLDALEHDDCRLTATWDEPDRSVEELVEELWSIHGSTFEVTLEEYRRLSLNVLHHEEEGGEQPASAAA